MSKHTTSDWIRLVTLKKCSSINSASNWVTTVNANRQTYVIFFSKRNKKILSDLISFHPLQKRAISFSTFFPWHYCFLRVRSFILIFRNCQSNEEQQKKKKNVSSVSGERVCGDNFEWYVDGIQSDTEMQFTWKVHSPRYGTSIVWAMSIASSPILRWHCHLRERSLHTKWEYNCNPWRVTNVNSNEYKRSTMPTTPCFNTQIPKYRHNLTTIGAHSSNSCGGNWAPQSQLKFNICLTCVIFSDEI